MNINRMRWADLVHEYGLDAKRLAPWDAVEAPFEGAWCVIRAHTTSQRHSHHERELFIAISGVANICLDEEKHLVGKGDIVAIQPQVEHFIENTFDEDFHMYSIWWDRDMAASYADRIEGVS